VHHEAEVAAAVGDELRRPRNAEACGLTEDERHRRPRIPFGGGSQRDAGKWCDVAVEMDTADDLAQHRHAIPGRQLIGRKSQRCGTARAWFIVQPV